MISVQSSVVVGYPDVMRAMIGPDKNDPPLIINSYTPIAAQIPDQFFQLVAGRFPQYADIMCSIYLIQDTAIFSMQPAWYLPGIATIYPVIDIPRCSVLDIPDHRRNISNIDIKVK